MAAWSRGASPERPRAPPGGNRVLAQTVELANWRLTEQGLAPLPEGLTPHSLRRTYASLLLARGDEVPYVMQQLGHTSPSVTLGIYAQAMFRGDGERERLRQLVQGGDLTPRKSSRGILV